MKTIVIFILLMLFCPVYAMNERLLLLNDEGLCVYDMNSVKLILHVDDSPMWRFCSVRNENGKISVALVNSQPFDSGYVKVKSVLFEEKTHQLMSIEDTLTDNPVYINSGLVNYKRQQSNDTFAVSSRNGNVYLVDAVEKANMNSYLFDRNESEPFISSYKRNRLMCGYYSPEISMDGKRIVCEYVKSSLDGKRIIGKKQIIEIDVITKEIIKLPFWGVTPRYSLGDQMILFRDIYEGKCSWKIFDKNNNSASYLPVAHDAVWLY